MTVRALPENTNTLDIQRDCGAGQDYRYCHDLVMAYHVQRNPGSSQLTRVTCEEHLADYPSDQLAALLAASYELPWPGNRPSLIALEVDWIIRETALGMLRARLVMDRTRYRGQTQLNSQTQISDEDSWHGAD